MAMGMMSVTIPTIAAAAGLYFFDKTHPSTQGMGGSFGSMVGKVKEEMKGSAQMPKLAPQFDGLFCFETLVGHGYAKATS